MVETGSPMGGVRGEVCSGTTPAVRISDNTDKRPRVVTV